MKQVTRVSLAVVLAAVACRPVPNAADGVTAITGVTLIDGTGRPPIAQATVVIRDGMIVAAGPADRVAIPSGAAIISGAGKFVVAGLWDSHVHLNAAGRAVLPILVRYGITSVRDLGGGLDSVRQWRAAVDSGQLVGPRIHLTGPIIENAGWLKRVAGLAIPGFSDIVNERIPVETEDDARRAVDSVAGLGVEVLKVRTSPGPAAYVALLEAARRRGLRTAGHQPSSDVGLRGALAAGQRSIEHIEGLGELEGMAGSARDSVARGFAAAEVWFTPTLVASFGRFQPESLITARATGVTAEPEQSLVTPALRASWTSQLTLKKYDSPLDEYRKMVVDGLAGMRRLKEAGVKVLAGTDLAVVNLFPGLALHDELAFLVDSLGMSPLQAIQAATVEPARYFGIADSIGTVEPGKRADLLILTADPLADIHNTRRIETVILRGRVIPARP